MEKFTYLAPTEVVFGRGRTAEVADFVKKYGGTRVFIVYGSERINDIGLLDQVRRAFMNEGIKSYAFGGAKPNPTMEHALSGVEKALEFGADFVLGIGGGSAIDTGKAIAHGIANKGVSIERFWNKELEITKSAPVGVILTIPASGSEMSNSAVLTNTRTGRKSGTSTDLNRPKFAILDPTLTFSLPKKQVACGITDIMMHTMDRYFNPIDNELTDAIAEALLRTVISKGRVAIDDSEDYDAMSELMWAGSLSHNGLTGLGGIRDFATHQLGHELSAMFDTTHGEALSAVWGSLALYIYKERPERFARFARNVWGICEEDTEKAAVLGIEKTVEYFKSLGMPVSLGECTGVQSDETLRDLAYRCSYGNTRTIGSFKVLNTEDMYNIYKMANK